MQRGLVAKGVTRIRTRTSLSHGFSTRFLGGVICGNELFNECRWAAWFQVVQATPILTLLSLNSSSFAVLIVFP